MMEIKPHQWTSKCFVHSIIILSLFSRFSKEWKPRPRSPTRSPERKSDKRKARSPDRRRSKSPDQRRRSKSLDRRRSRSSEKKRHSEKSPGRERKQSYDRSPDRREKKRSSDRSPDKTASSSSEKSSPTPNTSEKLNVTDSTSPTPTTSGELRYFSSFATAILFQFDCRLAHNLPRKTVKPVLILAHKSNLSRTVRLVLLSRNNFRFKTITARADNTQSSDPTRKRKRKSRWGEKPADLPEPAAKPVIAMINGVPVVVPTVVSTSPASKE